MKLTEIVLRDPFVLRADEERCYYLFGTHSQPVDGGLGFNCYRSCDLEEWEGPIPAFRSEPDFWATCDFWAPEAHRYRGAYYLFASFKSPARCRGTQILRAERPSGPYRAITEFPVTPAAWECLDGTLYVDESGTPWMVFCHEWLQIKDGSICAMALTADLTAAAGDVVELFHASEAPWVKPFGEPEDCFVTDGPFLYKENGKLWLLWSSFTENHDYAMGRALSESGNVTGPWRQFAEPVFRGDGGHGMRFVTFDGVPNLTVHQPNRGPEHPIFFPQNW